MTATPSSIDAAARFAVEAAAADTLRRRSRTAALRRVPAFVWLCALILCLMIVAALTAGLIAPHNPLEQTLLHRLQPPAWAEDGTPEYLLGSDHLGRDVLSRLLYGARLSLSIGLFAVFIGAIFGSLLGMMAGYFGGWTDESTMSLADIQLAFPFILLAIAIMAVLGPDKGEVPWKLIILVGISGWMTYARVCRGVVLSLKEREFIQAVRALGGEDWRILLKHLLPNMMSPIVVLGTLDLARLIILESTLSFLGLGVQPPAPSWGGMLLEGRQYLDSAWWISIFPGVAIMLTTVSISRGGDWLRDVLDPTLRAA